MSATDVNGNALEIGKYYIVDDNANEETTNNIKYVGLSLEGKLLFQSRTEHGGNVSYIFSPDSLEITPVDDDDPASDFEVDDNMGGRRIKKSQRSRKSRKSRRSRKSRKTKRSIISRRSRKSRK